jgi:Ca2+-binding RTX toxin-like protein
MSAFGVTGGAGNDWMRGGDGNDYFYITYGGRDTVFGGAGSDGISDYGGGLNAADRLNGGTGNDTLSLSGDYSAGFVFGASTLVSIEQIQYSNGFDYHLILHDDITPVGQTLIVSGYLEAPYGLTLDASQETDGNVSVTGGNGVDSLEGGNGDDYFSGNTGADTILGGGGDDLIDGGKGHDRLTGGTGGDTFMFEWEDSPAIPDLIKDLTNADAIDLSQIDADPGPALLTFTLVSTFSGAPGEMRLTYNAGSNLTKLLMDMDGDAASDMTILMSGQHSTFDNFIV